MSLLSAVQQAIKSYKVQQYEINDRIQLYRELLQSLIPQPKASSEESKVADTAGTGTDTSPGENEDIELLERALEKALRVRTGSEPSKKDVVRKKLSGPRGESGTAVVSSLDITHSSAASQGSQTTIKSTSKSASYGRKGNRRPGSSICSTLSSRPSASYNPVQSKTTNNKCIIQNHPASLAVVVHHQTVSASGSANHFSTLLSKNKSLRGNMQSGNDLRKTASVSTPSSNNIVAFSHADGSDACGLLQQNGVPSEQAAKWKSLRSKQNRLWDKVIALQRKPVPGRSHFMERMRTTFPRDWPCGSPDQTRSLVDRLTHQGRDLAPICEAKEIIAKQTSEMAGELGGKKTKYDSSHTRQRLEQTAEEFQSFADQAKQEWKAWDRWRPEGGCLCATGANSVWEDGITAPLPLTITYTTEAELQELENLRMRVALLQQEIYLEQALWDTLSPQLSSIVPGPGSPNPSVLRDLYSLLGEGGERFPTIVLDSEPD